MTTARSPSSEELAHLAACQSIVAHKGVGSPYVADCVVRAYQAHHVSALYGDLGWTCDENSEVLIIAGIGTLRMAWKGNSFIAAPASRAPLIAAPRAADASTRDQRMEACRACTHHRDGRCSMAGCGCAGLGSPNHAYSRCPIGTW